MAAKKIKIDKALAKFGKQSQSREQKVLDVEHSRHRTFDNFIVNLLSGIAAYCCFPKKPCINVSRIVDSQLALF